MQRAMSRFSQATITEDSFSLGELARTQRSCGYDRNMLEQGFFDALQAAVSWSLDGDALTLLDASATPLITFER